MIQLTYKVIAVQVPEGTTDHYIINSANGNGQGLFWKPKKPGGWLILPLGNWRIICLSKEATEGHAQYIVDQDELFINGKSQGVLYCNYFCVHDQCEWYKYASDSLSSLLTSKGCDPQLNYLLLKKD
jgi:hypothetical protein